MALSKPQIDALLKLVASAEGDDSALEYLAELEDEFRTQFGLDKRTWSA